MGDAPDFDSIDEAAESFRPSWDNGPSERPPAPAPAPPIAPMQNIIIGAPVIAIGDQHKAEADTVTDSAAHSEPPLPLVAIANPNARPTDRTSPGVAPPAVGSSPKPQITTQIGQPVDPNIAAMVAAAQAKIARANSSRPPPAPVSAPDPLGATVSFAQPPPPAFAPAFAPAPAFAQAPAPVAARPRDVPVPIAAVDPFGPGSAPIGADDDDIIIPKKSGGKVVSFVIAGVLVLGAAGAFVKFGLLAETPVPPKTTPSATAAAPPPPAPANVEIPPPPDKEELAAAAAASAPKTPEPPAKAEPEPPAPAAAPAPAPAPAPEVHAKADPRPLPKGAAPAPAPPPARHPTPAPAPAPKPATKPGSGGIVRDSPF